MQVSACKCNASICLRNISGRIFYEKWNAPREAVHFYDESRNQGEGWWNKPWIKEKMIELSDVVYLYKGN
jgi:hypothetical protein